MKKQWKRLISFVVCMALALTMCPYVTAVTVEDDYSPFDSEDTSSYKLYSTYSTGTIDGLTWSVYDNGLLEVSGTGAIPDYEYTSGAPWYSYRYAIDRILVRDGITQIGKNAFYGLSVTSVTLPFIGKSRTAVEEEGTFGYIFGYTTRAAYVNGTGQYIPIYHGNTTTRAGYIAYDNSTTSSYTHRNRYVSYTSGDADQYSALGFYGYYTAFYRSSSSETGRGTFYDYRVGGNVGSISSFTTENPTGTTWQYTCHDFYFTSSYVNSVKYDSWAMQSYFYYIPETLTKVTITDASRVPVAAFNSCTNLTEINLNDDITSIGSYAFRGATKLDVFDLPTKLTTMGKYAFKDCDSLQDIVIPDGVTNIPTGAFYDCDGLFNVKFSDNITVIAEEAFYGCGALRDFVLPEKLTRIGDSAFYDCDDLEHIIIPDNVTAIAPYAFFDCGATSLVIGDSVTTIGEYAFAYQNITALYVPDNVETIEKFAFRGCNKLTEITLPFIGKSRTAVEEEGTFGYIFGYTTRAAYVNGTGQYIPIYHGNTTTRAGYIAYDNSTTSSYTHRNRYVSYTSGDADQCSALGFYGYYTAFYRSSSSETGRGTFYDYRVGGNVGSTSSFTTENPTGTTWQYTCHDWYVGQYSVNGTIYYAYAMQSYFYYIPETLTKVTITDASRVPVAAFNSCTNLTEINLNSEITTVGSYAYANCPATVNKEPLDNQPITYPNSYTYTNGKDTYTYSVVDGEAIIIGCKTTSTNITLPTVLDGYTVTAIGYKGMANCTTLKSATIPDTITRLDRFAFSGCTNIDTVTIPATCKYVGSYAFSGCSRLTSVVIAEGVEFIGDNCFENCVALTAIVVPDSCTYLGVYAFYNCKALETATIGINVPSIGKYAFYNCVNLQSVVLGLAVESIGEYAFYNTALSRVTTYNKLKHIGDYAFASCDNLTRVTLKAGLLTIGEGAFKEDGLLTTINMTSTITDIGAYAFYGCTSLASTVIPALVTKVNDYTYAYCTSLASVKVNGTVESIGHYAFYKAILPSYDFKEGLASIEQGAFAENKLTNITLPNSLVYIGEQAFNANRDLVSVSMPDSVTDVQAYAFAETGDTLDVVIRYNTGTVADNILKNTPVTSVVMEEGIEAIGSYAFAYCNKLSDITFPESLKTIGSYSFYDNRKYSEITLPKNVISMGSYAFARGYALNKINIPDSMQTIGVNAFYRGNDMEGSPSLTVALYYNQGALCDDLLKGQHMHHVYVADNVYSMGNSVFHNALNLETVSLPDTIASCGTKCFYGSSTELYIRSVDGLVDNELYKEKLSGVNYLEITDTDIGDYAFYGNTNYYDVKITDGLIGEYAFAENTWIQDVSIIGETDIGDYAFSNSDTYRVTITGQSNIGNYAFSNNTSMREATITGSADVGDYAFSNDISLTKTTITGSTNVGNYAFYNCNAMKTFTIDGVMETIGEHGFDGCKSMGAVVLPSTVNYIGAYAFYDCNSMDAINIPEGVEKLLSHTFYGCASLKQVQIPDSVTEIQDYVFYGCVKATSIKISEQCKSIGECAFYNCKGLLSLTIPDSVETIGDYAFRSCGAIKELVFGDNVKQIGTCAFYDCNGLETIMFGTGVEELNDRLFYGCVNLQDITLEGDVDFIHELAFYGAEATVVYAFENEYVENYCYDNGLEYYDLNRDFTMVMTEPDKLAYTEYEALDTTGLVLDLTYTNGVERTITTGYTVSGYDPTVLGDQTVTVTYNGRSTTFNVNVTARTVESVSVIAGAPAPVIVGEQADLSGLTIMVTFTDGMQVELTEGFTIAGYDPNVVGEQQLTITYREVATTLNLTVNDYTRGDINGDGIVTMKDVTRLVNYLNDSTVETIDMALDVNGDGVVSIKDVTRLTEYLANNTVEIF